MVKNELKYSIFLFCLLWFQSYSIGQTSLKTRTVTLSCENRPLRSILQEIEKQTKFHFVYHDELVDGKHVTCTFENTPLENTLQQICKISNLAFIFQAENRIVLFKQLIWNGSRNSIQGRVIDVASQRGLARANVYLSGTSIGASTDEYGHFIIPNIPKGEYDLKCSFIGFTTETIHDIILSENTHFEYLIVLKMKPIPLKGITVTPSHFTLQTTTPVTSQILTRKDIEQNPKFANDIYRYVSRLPGVLMKDFSSRFTVRGGEHHQVLVLMDELELYEPFHLKHIFGGALSIIDAAATESVELLTGAFTANYGDRLSGVFKINSKKPPADQKRFSLGISLLNARILSEGSFRRNKGSWLLSARRGSFDLGFSQPGINTERPSSNYYDFMGKLQYHLNERHNLFVHFLHANDKLANVESGGGKINNTYNNTYGWLRLESILNPRLYIHTLASAGHVDHLCRALRYQDGNQNVNYSISNLKNFHFYNLKQDWHIELAEHHDLIWGFELKNLMANYDYTSLSQSESPDDPQAKTRDDTLQVAIQPSGLKFGFYFSHRIRIFRPLTTELGIRYDHASYTEDELLSPRLNLVYAIGSETFLRAGWGRFYQTQGIHEFHVQDGENGFYPAECAEHGVLGIEHISRSGIHIRLEGYRKKLSNLRPVYRNWQQFQYIFPEMLSDRLKILLNGSIAKGVEVYVKKDTGVKLTWWASYTLAYINDYVWKIINRDNELNYNKYIPGIFDQRHTLHFDVHYRPNSK